MADVRLQRRQALGLCYRCDQPLAPTSCQSCAYHLEKLRRQAREWSRRRHGRRPHDPLSPEFGYKDRIRVGLQKRPNPRNTELAGVVKFVTEKKQRGECIECNQPRVKRERCLAHWTAWRIKRSTDARERYHGSEELQEQRRIYQRTRYRSKIRKLRQKRVSVPIVCQKCGGCLEEHEDYAKCLNCGWYAYPMKKP